MALDLIKFGYKELLTAASLNTLDDNISEAIRHIGMQAGETYYDWCVVGDSRRYLDKVYLFDNSTGEYYDFTPPARHANVTPAFPHSLSGWNASNDFIFFAWNDKFYELTFDFSANPPNLTGSWSWAFWNGSTWTPLVLNSDSTTGWTSDGTIVWLAASVTDWEPISLNVAMSTTKAENEYRYLVRMTPGADASATRITQVIKELRTDELQVLPTTPASMYLRVRPGVAIIDGNIVPLPYETGIAISAPSANKHYAAVQITTDGDIVIDYSPISAAPDQCNARTQAIKLADVLIESSDTSITSGDITDMRNIH